MSVFLVIGAFGVLVVVLSLVFGDLLEGLFESIDIDVGGGLFSTPVIGSFLGAFGFAGAWVLSATDAGTGFAALAGLAAGIVLGAGALVVTRALMHMPTDAPVRTADLIGKGATVVTPIAAGRFGEVALVHQGQRMKLNARAEVAIPQGAAVVIVAVNSPSSVLVEAERDFWGDDPPPLSEGDTPS